MMRLSALLLVSVGLVACDDVTQMSGEPDGGPYPALNMIQLKGYERSDWRQTDDTAERAPAFAGHDRPRLGAQVTAGARVFHLPYYPISGDAVDLGGYFGWDVYLHRDPDDAGPCPQLPLLEDSLQSTCSGNLLSSCTNDILFGNTANFDYSGDRTGGVIGLPSQRHAPIFILISHQPQRYPVDVLGCYSLNERERLGMWPEGKLASLEAIPAGRFDAGSVVTPDELRRGYRNLRTAIEMEGWPSMENYFGRYFFILLDTGVYRDNYRAGLNMNQFGLGLTYPMIFTVADDPSEPDAAFFSVPASDIERIRSLVAQGFIVHAHSLVPAELEAARQAGAQLLTGLELDDIAFDGPAVCNPVTATEWAGCQPTDFERPPPAGP